MAREEVKNVENAKDKTKWEAWELVTGIGSSSCQFPFTEFFDSSCYENSKYGILIAAAMGHRYENSAKTRPDLKASTCTTIFSSICKIIE